MTFFNPHPHLGGGGGGHPQVVFPGCTPHRLSYQAGILHSNIYKLSLEILKISSLHDLRLVRYDLVLEVMSGQILTSRARHSFDPNSMKP